jgi:hypothetical protein
LRILGIVRDAHDTGVAVLEEGLPALVLEEERLNREKHTQKFPHLSLEAAFSQLKLGIGDIDVITTPWDTRELRRTFTKAVLGHLPSSLALLWPGAHAAQDSGIVLLTLWLKLELRRHLGVARLPLCRPGRPSRRPRCDLLCFPLRGGRDARHGRLWRRVRNQRLHRVREPPRVLLARQVFRLAGHAVHARDPPSCRCNFLMVDEALVSNSAGITACTRAARPAQRRDARMSFASEETFLPSYHPARVERQRLARMSSKTLSLIPRASTWVARLSKYSRFVPRSPNPVAIMSAASSGLMSTPGALPIHDEGKGVDGSLWCRHFAENRDVAFPDHLPHPQDFGLSINRVRRDSQGKADTFTAHVQRSHESRLFLRSATDLHLQAEATMEAGQCRRPYLNDVNGGIPHQGTVGENPEILSQPAFQRLASRSFPLFVGAPPVVSIAKLPARAYPSRRKSFARCETSISQDPRPGQLALVNGRRRPQGSA